MKLESAFVKVARAIERGTLPAGTQVIRAKNSIQISAVETLGGHDPNPMNQVAAWVKESFPGGTNTLDFSPYRRPSRAKMRRGVKAQDLWRYVATLEDGSMVSTRFIVEHECFRYRGYAETTDGHTKIGWACQTCDKPVLKGRARQLGLIPYIDQLKPTE